MNPIVRIIYVIAGAVFLTLGIVGLLLPLVPGMVFILLAAGAFARSVPAWHRWLHTHPWLGPPLVRWERERCLHQRTKWIASAMLLVSAVGSFYALRAEPLAAMALATVVALVLGYLLTRATCRAPAASNRVCSTGKRA